jgi:hypothetical protein
MISSYDRGKSPPFLDYNQIENKKNIYRLFYLLLKSVIFLKSDGQQFHH